MNGAQLKNKIDDGSIIYGTMVSASKNIKWVNVLAEVGLDYVIIDTEHSPFSRSEVSDLILMLTSVGIVPVVRIPTPSVTEKPLTGPDPKENKIIVDINVVIFASKIALFEFL